MPTQQSTAMTVADIAAVRELITYARSRGWIHIIYNGSFGNEHVLRAGASFVGHAAKVTWADGVAAYFEPARRVAKATLRPKTAAEVTDWLQLLGLLPTVAS